MEDGYGKCHECRKFGTLECPTSSKCLKFDNRPYFESKQKEEFTKKIVEFYKWMRQAKTRGEE